MSSSESRQPAVIGRASAVELHIDDAVGQSVKLDDAPVGAVGTLGIRNDRAAPACRAERARKEAGRVSRARSIH